MGHLIPSLIRVEHTHDIGPRTMALAVVALVVWGLVTIFRKAR